jgi:hypothetical protein
MKENENEVVERKNKSQQTTEIHRMALNALIAAEYAT